MSGREFKSFRGELRKSRSGHHNERNRNEIVEIRKARCREVYDLGVADDPHLFALASGVLSHNSKPNPMPESVTDRCTKAHEYVFLLAKSARYFYDAEAVKDAAETGGQCGLGFYPSRAAAMGRAASGNEAANPADGVRPSTRNRRSVWTIATAPYKEAHFATWPPKLVEPMIRAGTSEKGCCADCGAQWVRVVERTGNVLSTGGSERGNRRSGNASTDFRGGSMNCGEFRQTETVTTGWQPSCQCNAGDPIPCTVLDPFGGSGTTLGVANALGRHGIACELNPEYAALMPARVRSIVDAYYGRASTPSIEPGEGQLSLFKK